MAARPTAPRPTRRPTSSPRRCGADEGQHRVALAACSCAAAPLASLVRLRFPDRPPPARGSRRSCDFRVSLALRFWRKPRAPQASPLVSPARSPGPRAPTRLRSLPCRCQRPVVRAASRTSARSPSRSSICGSRTVPPVHRFADSPASDVAGPRRTYIRRRAPGRHVRPADGPHSWPAFRDLLLDEVPVRGRGQPPRSRCELRRGRASRDNLDAPVQRRPLGRGRREAPPRPGALVSPGDSAMPGTGRSGSTSVAEEEREVHAVDSRERPQLRPRPLSLAGFALRDERLRPAESPRRLRLSLPPAPARHAAVCGRWRRRWSGHDPAHRRGAAGDIPKLVAGSYTRADGGNPRRAGAALLIVIAWSYPRRGVERRLNALARHALARTGPAALRCRPAGRALLRSAGRSPRRVVTGGRSACAALGGSSAAAPVRTAVCSSRSPGRPEDGLATRDRAAAGLGMRRAVTSTRPGTRRT